MVSLLASLPYPCCGCCFSKRALAGPVSLEREKSETPTHTHQELREGAGGQRRPEADRIGQYEKNQKGCEKSRQNDHAHLFFPLW